MPVIYIIFILYLLGEGCIMDLFDELNEETDVQSVKPRQSDPKSVVDRVTHELRLYMDEPIDAKLDAVQYWQQPRYPMLTKIAFALLSISATSVPGERMFSRAVFLVDDLRSRLKPENVNQMIFLNCNKDL